MVQIVLIISRTATSKDAVIQRRFEQVVLGLSGGIDSAVTAALAVTARLADGKAFEGRNEAAALLAELD